MNERRLRYLNFPKPGNPGAKFKNHFEKMVKTLTLPKTAKEELNIPDDPAGVPVASRGAMSQSEQIPTEGGDKSQAEERKDTSALSNIEEEGGQQPEETKGGDERTSTAKKGVDGELNEERILRTVFAEGKYHLIPSFFRTMITLKKAKREFAVVF